MLPVRKQINATCECDGEGRGLRYLTGSTRGVRAIVKKSLDTSNAGVIVDQIGLEIRNLI